MEELCQCIDFCEQMGGKCRNEREVIPGGIPLPHEKQARDYLEAWRTDQAAMQELRGQLAAEGERVRVLRDGMREIVNLPETLPDLDGYDWFDDAQLIAKNALQATAQEDV